MPKVTFKINGKDVLEAKVSAAIQNAGPAVAQALYMFSEGVMTASKRVVPVETGALMNTGRVNPPEITGNKATVTMGYGSESVGYAMYVHENLNPGVNWTRPGSGPKYLENPLKARQNKLPGMIAQAIKDSIGGKK